MTAKPRLRSFQVDLGNRSVLPFFPAFFALESKIKKIKIDGRDAVDAVDVGISNTENDLELVLQSGFDFRPK